MATGVLFSFYCSDKNAEKGDHPVSWWNVNKRYRNIKRYREIGEILLKHGFGYLTEQLDLLNLIPLRKRLFKREGGEDQKLPRGTRIRMVLEELGPTFVKFGQALSIRPDLVPPDIIVELERLQDEVAPLPFSIIEERLCQELGCPVKEAFKYVSQEPMAAASIGQVHLGQLHNGQKVVIKVQRPGIEETINTDLDILLNLATILQQRVSASEFFDPVGVVGEFSRLLVKELDYRLEGRNADKFRRNFQGDETVYIPEIYWEFTTKYILTMEFVDGIKVSHIDELMAKGHDRHSIAYHGAKAVLKQIIIFGFFHADPHPGNIIVKDNGSVAFIDFGMVGRLCDEHMRGLSDLFLGMIQKDSNRILGALQRIGIVSEGKVERGLKLEIMELIDEYYERPVGEIEIGLLMTEITETASRYNIKMPLDFVLLVKSILTIEGVGKKLDPDFNIATIVEPFMKEYVRTKRYRERLFRSVTEEAISTVELALNAPKKVDNILTRVEKGELEVKMRMDELRLLVSRLDLLTNRLILGMVTTGIIIGSSLIMQTERVPMIWGFPLIGVIGYLLAGFFGIFFIFWLLRSGRF